MRIAESHVNLASQRLYQETGTKGSTRITEDFLSSYENYAGKKIEENSLDELENISCENDAPKPSAFNTLTLKDLLQRLKSQGLFNGPFNNGGGYMTYSEFESTSFHADGMAVTADGRKIDFNIDIQMTRSYREYMNISPASMRNALIDPLIVNIGDGLISVSDQKFLFDLDGDGTKEEISMLGKGSGFLALDLNEDGIINDGRELFGTQSGNGFSDLTKYDTDTNGWIDENDEVFSRLKVWCKNDAGEDILMDLKEAGIGAIFLGSAETEFSLNDMYNETNGQVRQTGFFLKENGIPAAVAQIDLAAAAEGTKQLKEKARIAGNGQIINLSSYYVNFYELSQIKRKSYNEEEAKQESSLKTLSDKNKQYKKRLEEQYKLRQKRAKELEEQSIERKIAKRKFLEKVMEKETEEKKQRA